MVADTVYKVFLALSSEEREKLIVLVNSHNKPEIKNIQKSKKKPILTKEEAIKHLIETIFKLK